MQAKLAELAVPALLVSVPCDSSVPGDLSVPCDLSAMPLAVCTVMPFDSICSCIIFVYSANNEARAGITAAQCVWKGLSMLCTHVLITDAEAESVSEAES